MVSFYGYGMWHHKWEVVKPSLSENTCFFFSIKVNLVAKIMQSAYLRDIFHVKHKKITTSRGFNLISNSW